MTIKREKDMKKQLLILVKKKKNLTKDYEETKFGHPK